MTTLVCCVWHTQCDEALRARSTLEMQKATWEGLHAGALVIITITMLSSLHCFALTFTPLEQQHRWQNGERWTCIWHCCMAMSG